MFLNISLKYFIPIQCQQVQETKKEILTAKNLCTCLRAMVKCGMQRPECHLKFKRKTRLQQNIFKRLSARLMRLR